MLDRLVNIQAALAAKTRAIIANHGVPICVTGRSHCASSNGLLNQGHRRFLLCC